jgi:hypothetical protein
MAVSPHPDARLAPLSAYHWTGTFFLGFLLLLWLAVQAMLIGFTTGIQYVMLVNGVALPGFALWPSVRRLYRQDPLYSEMQND